MNRNQVVAQERRQVELEARDVAGEVGNCRPRSRQICIQRVIKAENFRLVFRIVHYPDFAIFQEFHNRPQGRKCLMNSGQERKLGLHHTRFLAQAWRRADSAADQKQLQWELKPAWSAQASTSKGPTAAAIRAKRAGKTLQSSFSNWRSGIAGAPRVRDRRSALPLSTPAMCVEPISDRLPAVKCGPLNGAASRHGGIGGARPPQPWSYPSAS